MLKLPHESKRADQLGALKGVGLAVVFIALLIISWSDLLIK